MKQFESLTEKEILTAAYDSILARWAHQIETNENFKAANGRECHISKHWIEKYSKQLDELHAAILELEQAEQND